MFFALENLLFVPLKMQILIRSAIFPPTSVSSAQLSPKCLYFYHYQMCDQISSEKKVKQETIKGQGLFLLSLYFL